MILDDQLDPYRIPVTRACELFDVSRSGYYKWVKYQDIDLQKRRDEPIIEASMKIIEDNAGYGYRRVTKELHRRGHHVNHKRVHRIMRENNLTFKRKMFRLMTTDSEHGNPVYPNLVKRMKITRPNQVWASDLTYVQLKDDFIYLAVVLDLYGRRCIGWSLSRHLDTKNVLDALHMAIYERGKVHDISGLIHHSDRGVQ